MGNTNYPTREVTVTPKMAAGWLKRQQLLEAQDPLMRNRNVKDDKVRAYSRDMKAGQWKVNGETIIFASNGRILDGQHRLLACVDADASFRTLVVEDVPHEAMQTIDTGVMRTAGDQLAIFGHQNSKWLAAALGVLYRWEATNRRGFDWRARGTRLELFDILEKHPGVEAFCTRVSRLQTFMSPGLAAALWYLFDQKDAVLAAQFFEALATGTNLNPDEPVFQLRERLIRDRQDRMRGTHREGRQVSMEYAAELTFRAWDATLRGVKLVKLQRGTSRNAKVLLTRRTKTAGRKVTTA